jgi:hypothetical protein
MSDSSNNKKNKKHRMGLAAMSEEQANEIRQAAIVAVQKKKEQANGVPLRMGLACLPESERKRISKLGTKAVLETYDVEHWQNAGRKGGMALIERYSIVHMSNLGKRGGIVRRRKGKRMKKKDDDLKT